MVKWLACIFALGACATTSFDGRVLRGNGFAADLGPIPSQWVRTAVPNDDAVAFRDDAHRGTIAIHGRCGKDADDVPLAALTGHLFLRFSEPEVHSQAIVPFDDREAMHTELAAKLDGVKHTFDAWVLKKDGCVYDLIYFAPPAAFQGGVGVFRTFVAQFTTRVAPS